MAIMSPFRTQALLIKDVIAKEAEGKKGGNIMKKVKTIGAFEDFVSCKFSTIIVSMTRTSDFK